MRFLVSTVSIIVCRRLYLPRHVKAIGDKWENAMDRQALKAIRERTLKRIKTPFMMNYPIVEDVKAIIIDLQNIYHRQGEKQEEMKFSFSIGRLIETSLLFFKDIYYEYSGSWWFKFVQNTRLLWFNRVLRFRTYYAKIQEKIPFYETLQKYRILSLLFRVITFPILGLPSLVWYLIRSVLLGSFTEGMLRFVYTFALLRIGYYGMYLFGEKKSELDSLITSLGQEDIQKFAEIVEKRIKPKDESSNRTRYAEAVEVYMAELKKYLIDEDKLFLHAKRTKLEETKLFLDKVARSAQNALSKLNPLEEKQIGDMGKLLDIVGGISKVYRPKGDNPYMYLRVGEVVEAGFMASVLILNIVYQTPGAKQVIDAVPVQFVMMAKDITKGDIVKDAGDKLKLSYKVYQIFRIAGKVFNVFRKIAAPYTLIWTIGSPILFQHLQGEIKRAIFHRIGRLTLYTWEANDTGKHDSVIQF